MAKTEENNKEKTASENKSEEKDKSKVEVKNPEEELKITQEKLLRTLAEMENQRRRFEKERQEAFDFGGFNFAVESLPLIDNIERAITSFKNDESLKNNKDLNKIIDGIDIVKNDLISIFRKNGIEPIECMNKKFDPNFHQAMSEVEDENKEPGTILQEIQAGYMLGERLLRPALVSVSKKNSSIDRENRDKKEEK